MNALFAGVLAMLIFALLAGLVAFLYVAYDVLRAVEPRPYRADCRESVEDLLTEERRK